MLLMVLMFWRLLKTPRLGSWRLKAVTTRMPVMFSARLVLTRREALAGDLIDDGGAAMIVSREDVEDRGEPDDGEEQPPFSCSM